MRTIKGLQVRYIRGARRVDIHHPDEAVVEISGDNGSGKSSTLDAVEWGIRGKRALPEDPLHHGATSGHVELDLGDLRITRRINEDNVARGGTVKIEATDGSKWGQRDVEELYGAWTFDPQAFARLKPDDQVAQIRALAGPEFCAELERLEQAITNARHERTEASRLERSFGRIEQPPCVESIDTSKVVAELQQARAHNEARHEALTEVQQYKTQVKAATDKKVAAHARLVAAMEAERLAAEELDRLTANPPPQPPDALDVTELEERLANASKQNAAADRYQHALREFDQWKTSSLTHRRLDVAVKELEEQRRQHLLTAELPVDGLSWEGSRIALNGTPFAGLSTTEQLLLSARIGMALSPDLRVMMVREGGLIDTAKFTALKHLAKERGYQIWIETAGEGHTPDALVIQSGELDDTSEWSE